MAEKLVATLNIPFSDSDGVGEDAGKNRIVLQQMTERMDSQGQLWARCFPHQGVRFKASVGTVTPGEVRSHAMSEGLKFSNSARATLKFPGASNVAIDASSSVLLKKTKDIYGHTTIVPAFVTLTWDADQEAVIVTERGQETPIYGACFVRYDALYQVLYYKPNTVSTPVGGGNYAFAFNIGTIFGYNDYTVETLDMELDISSSSSWVEYARVTSKIVLDAKGVWEFPQNWESTYQGNKDKVGDRRDDYPEPGHFDGFDDEIDQDNSFVDTRIHCIIEVNTVGTLRFNDHNNGGSGYWAWFAPYFGDSSWNPTYEVKFTDPPGGKKASSAKDFQYDLNNSTWRDVFLSVNKAQVLKDLQNDYPGVVEA